jgi:glycosyltransferase involved in cell wall biosynthesis
MKRFIAVQLGARSSYAMPSLLEKAGMLEAFYTDICGNHKLTGIVLNILPKFFLTGSLRNLYGRELPDNLLDKTNTFPYLALRHFIKRQLAGSDEKKGALALTELSNSMGKAIVEKDWENATHYFSMFGECTPALRHAKKQGLTTVTEIFIILNAYRYVAKERAKYPDLEQAPDQNLLTEALIWLQEVCDLSDWIIAPSEAVKEDLVDHWKVKEERCFVIPYGVNESWLEVTNSPIQGRVLMAGTANLRKGIHILGEAANQLPQNNYEFRVAGEVSDAIGNSPFAKSLNLLGRISRIDIKQEYQVADVFVLPSVAEGSALVTYEALACGIPVITTESAGSVVRDGVEGFIVPESDADALAERIEELVENRELRSCMGKAARERAKEYTWNRYAERLLSVLKLPI